MDWLKKETVEPLPWPPLIAVASGYSLFFLVMHLKPWTKKTLRELPSDIATESTTGDPRHLLLYRLSVLAFMLALGVDQLRRRGARVLFFFTTWSWWSMALFFLLATLASTRRVHRDAREKKRRRSAGGMEEEEEEDGVGEETKQQQQRRRTKRANGVGVGKGKTTTSTSTTTTATTTTIPLVDAAAVALLHVVLPSSLLVVALTWLLLVPMLLSSPDKARVALSRSMFFNFASYCQHGANAFFALGEVFLNKIPMTPYLGGLLALYSSLFGTFALAFYRRTGSWLYPFLNAHKPWAAVAYAGIFVANWVFFGVAALSFKARDLMVERSSRSRARRKRV